LYGTMTVTMRNVMKTAELPTRARGPRRIGPGPAAAGLATVLAALLAGCAAPPARDAATATATPATDTRPAAPAPAPTTAPAAVEPAPVAMSPQDAQRTLANALDQLQAGQEDAAEAELKRLLQSDPSNRLAQSLLRQIKEDPQALLGRESFAYRVQPGESLSRIAQRFLGDVHLFYALARYNNIKVPKTLAGGQTIRVPGKAPPPGANATSPAPAPAVAPPPPSAAATPPAPPPKAEPVPESPEAAAARAKRETQAKVARLTREARAAYAKQDLDGALRSWDAVLETEPENRNALLERQKVLDLKEKLRKVK